MQSKKKSRAVLITSIGISLFAALSMGVSTFAWFQAAATGGLITSTTAKVTSITVNKPDDYSFYAYKGNLNRSYSPVGTFHTTNEENCDFIAVSGNNIAQQTNFGTFTPGENFVYAMGIQNASSLSITINKIISNNTVKQGLIAHAGSSIAKGSKGITGVDYYTRSSSTGAGYLDDGVYHYTYSFTADGTRTASSVCYAMEDLGLQRYAYDTANCEINVGWAIDIFEYEEVTNQGSYPSNYSSILTQLNSSSAYSDRFNFNETTNASVLAAAGTGTTPNKVIDNLSIGIYDNNNDDLNYAKTEGALDSTKNIYVFFSLVFSDHSSTYYKEVKGPTDPTEIIVANTTTNRYFKKDTNGNSNCYAGLKFALSEISVLIG